LEKKIEILIKKIFKNLKSKTFPPRIKDISEIKGYDNTISDGSTTTIQTLDQMLNDNKIKITKNGEKESKPKDIQKREEINMHVLKFPSYNKDNKNKKYLYQIVKENEKEKVNEDAFILT